MEKWDFMNEGIDIKRLFLCLWMKIGYILVITLAGALLCGVCYVFARETTKPVYQSISKFYLQFAHDPNGDVVQYYNGFTWNDLLHSDMILNHVIAAMEDNGISGKLTKEELRDNTFKGEILSDLRLLTITFSAENMEKTALIQKSMETGLLEFAVSRQEIISMELIHSTEPKRLVWENNLYRALILGAVLSLLLALIIWWVYYILDDSLYTIHDADKRYPYLIFGILLKGETIETADLYFKETKENFAMILKDEGNPYFLSVEAVPYPDGIDLRKATGVVIQVPFGNRNGKLVERCINYLRNLDIEILGLVITEAEEKFLNLYYWGKKVK